MGRIGLSLHLSDPLIKAGRSALGERLTGKASSYFHEKRRLGGWWSATIRLNEPEENINNWIQSGIGRHFEAYNTSLVKAFEGFINKIDIRQGGQRQVIGPLVGIGNQVKVTYSTIDPAISPPVIGRRATTSYGDNIPSQIKFGKWQKLTSDDGSTEENAIQLRDMYLADASRSFPPVSGDLSLSGSGAVTVTLHILGYWHWFLAYLYNNNTEGNINLSQKIINIIQSDPNNIFSSDFSKITTNTTLVPEQMTREEKAANVLKKLSSAGDKSTPPRSYSLGVFNDRRIEYTPTPIIVKYHARRGKLITDRFGSTVYPWDVEPNEWVLKTDALVGSAPPINEATLGADNRSGLIQVVKYSTPFNLSIKSQHDSELDLFLSSQGLGVTS